MVTKNMRMFWRAIALWMEAGCPEQNCFKQRFGLCSNLYQWLKSSGLPFDHASYERHLNALKRTFPKGKRDLPFNLSQGSYDNEAFAHNCMRNVARRAHIAKMKPQSEELRQFYRDINSWDDRSYPQGPKWPFVKTAGLCYNLKLWCEKHGHDERALKTEMRSQFNKDGRSMLYPFNGNSTSFDLELRDKLVWDNNDRRSWVQAHTT